MSSLKDWLGLPVTVEEVEEHHAGPSGVPFGRLHEEWVRMKSQMRPGDELRGFCSLSDSWAHCAGRAGYVILRGDEVIASITYMMN